MNFVPANSVAYCTLSILTDRSKAIRTVLVDVDGASDIIEAVRRTASRCAATGTLSGSKPSPLRPSWAGHLSTAWSPRQIIDAFLDVFDDGARVLVHGGQTMYSFWSLPIPGPLGSGRDGGSHAD